MKIKNWSCGLVYGIKNTVPSSVNGDTDDRIIKGRNIKSDVVDEMSMTNSTALSLSDSFLKISYMPRKTAEQITRGIHIECIKKCRDAINRVSTINYNENGDIISFLCIC